VVRNVRQEKGPPSAGKGTKGPEKPMTPRKALLQSIVD
jgi:hypothetical protein